MAKLYTSTLLTKLSEQLKGLSDKVQRHFSVADNEALLFKPAPDKWSITECLEHLNTYGRYYIPAMQRAIANAKPEQKHPVAAYKPGWFGNYFTASMQMTPANTVKTRMKTPKAYNPVNKSLNPKTVISEFLAQQEQFLALAMQAASVDLGSIRVPISISKTIRLKLGDTLRFNAAHIARHMAQAERVLAAYNNKTLS